MAMRTLCAKLFLILLTAATIAQSKPHIASEGVHRKLEDALIANSSLQYMMQEVFLTSKILPQNMVHLHVCVTAGSVQPGSCDNSSLFGGQNNFTYCQWFQWSSSALVNLISIDQLLILDNIISYNVFHLIEHRESVDVPLQIDALPCEIKQENILAALMQLLPWVCLCILNNSHFLYCIFSIHAFTI